MCVSRVAKKLGDRNDRVHVLLLGVALPDGGTVRDRSRLMISGASVWDLATTSKSPCAQCEQVVIVSPLERTVWVDLGGVDVVVRSVIATCMVRAVVGSDGRRLT